MYLSSFERKQCNECKVYLLILGIAEGFLVSSIIVVYSGFKYKVIISQQQCQHSLFEINKHQYSSINIDMNVFDTSLNKGPLDIGQDYLFLHAYGLGHSQGPYMAKSFFANAK